MTVRDQIAETVARIAADHCGTGVVRQAERAASVGGGAGSSASRGIGPVESLWRELAAAGLDRATAPESVAGAGLAWRDALPLAIAVGEFALPVPLVETLAAHALAAAAGAALPDSSTPRAGIADGASLPGAAGFARVARDGGTLVAESVAWGDRVGTVIGVDAQGGVRLLDAALATRDDARNPAGEIRSRMVWREPPESVGSMAGDALAALGAALRAAQLAGAMRRVLAMTVRYAGEREQFGRPIGRFQAVQQQVALMAELVVQATIGAELAFDGDDLLPDPVRAACAKQVASANALQCAAIAHAVHGAIGVTEEYDLQLFTRRLRAWAAEWGGAHHWAAVLGRGLLAGGRASVWHAVIDASAGSFADPAADPTSGRTD
ncbi:acyl-CoA dehydrogenase family protein [Zeimonas arvi]|uniref:Acyl-CoA dehydrogenase n=1 Tax=Zeimonas arvi TaxID=2498847 RepID=A0A5C8NU01_9BURK|nr:acyl-CoA dehydrogenase family protein [Zeimonas arvi]TXL64636.1 acyl-CoA dehydrogenase [Zeimonas arvi]